MKRLEEEYKGKGLKVMWVGFQDREDKLRAFASKFGITELGFDEKNVLSKKLGVSYGAGLIFIDGEGMVRERVSKGLTEEEFKTAIGKIT